MKKLKRKFILYNFNLELEEELEVLAFYQNSEKEILRKNIYEMSKKEYSDYLELYSVAKQSAYSNYLNRKRFLF